MAKDWKALQWVTENVQNIIGTHLPSICDFSVVGACMEPKGY